MEAGQEFKIKIVLLGDGAVGKTSLIRKYVYDEFDDQYLMTFGSKTSKKVIELPHPQTDENIKMVLMLADIMGQTDVKNIHDAYMFGAKAAIIVCDLTREETLKSTTDWVNKITKIAGEVPMIFVANKYDLILDAKFDINDLKAVADTHESHCFVSSAKTGENVEKLFKVLAENLMLKRI